MENHCIIEQCNVVCGLVLADVNDSLLQPITENILRTIPARGAMRKSLGMDGLNLEFCAMMWQYIKEGMLCVYNEILLQGGIQADQKMGILVHS